jgi:hypothetical protein
MFPHTSGSNITYGTRNGNRPVNSGHQGDAPGQTIRQMFAPRAGRKSPATGRCTRSDYPANVRPAGRSQKSGHRGDAPGQTIRSDYPVKVRADLLNNQSSDSHYLNMTARSGLLYN